MIYLDTGCLVKLYYPEPDSATVIAQVRGKPICLTPLHELEFVNALQLKVFFKDATTAQAAAARAMVEEDLRAGLLISIEADWKIILREAVSLAARFTSTLGARSLDVLHCAAAKVMAAPEFVTTDARQIKFATAMGLNVVSL